MTKTLIRTLLKGGARIRRKSERNIVLKWSRGISSREPRHSNCLKDMEHFQLEINSLNIFQTICNVL